MTHLGNWEFYVTAIASTLVASLVIYKKGIVPIVKHFSEWYNMMAKIDHVYSEMRTNGGESIKDKIGIIETKVDRVAERQKSILHEHEHALVETNADGDVIWVNRTYTRLVQRDIHEVLGHGWINVIAPEDRERVVLEWEHAVRDHREIYLYFKFETPGGCKIPVKARSYVLRDSKKQVMGYLATVETLDENV
jgi:PAS domain S-box-containing protein